jgi:hypothetical protein
MRTTAAACLPSPFAAHESGDLLVDMRQLAALLMALVTLVMPSDPPVPPNPCEWIEPVYALTDAGDLVEQRFCRQNAGAFLEPRTIAHFTTAPTLFWGGRHGGAAIIYSVTTDGQLWWARQDPVTGRLGRAIAVGTAFGDWNRYKALFGTGDGLFFGVDRLGHLIGWQHMGWTTGEDAWQAPVDLGSTCPWLGKPVYALPGSPYRYVALQYRPSGYAVCDRHGEPALMSLLPTDLISGSATMAPMQAVTYALTRNGQLVRLILECDDNTSVLTWRSNASTLDSYQSIFAGSAYDFRLPVRAKWEWQWPFYQDCDRA